MDAPLQPGRLNAFTPSTLPDPRAFADTIIVQVAANGTRTAYISDGITWNGFGGAGAPVNSPTFTGIPAAPTATAGNNSTQIATTAYADAIAALKANLASPTFTGAPAAPTPTALDASTKLATTAYTDAATAVSTIVSVSAAKTFALADAGKTQLHPAADTTVRTWTIDANATVAFPVGTVLIFDNESGAGILTIAITTDTLQLVGAAGTTGTRTLASGGRAVAQKVTTTKWRIAGGSELT